ncbi:MAG: cupredoxin domain-containing protein [Gemmatimonadaceae bacterium]
MNTASSLTVALCLAAALTACAKSDDSATDTTGLDTAAAASPVPATPVATNQPAVIHVPLTEWSVVVSQGVVAPGTFTFHAMNQGTHPHAFEIEGNGQEWKSDPIPPGGTATLTPTLTAGTYEVYCPIVDSQGNHQERGMRTTFSVR